MVTMARLSSFESLLPLFLSFGGAFPMALDGLVSIGNHTVINRRYYIVTNVLLGGSSSIFLTISFIPGVTGGGVVLVLCFVIFKVCKITEAKV